MKNDRARHTQPGQPNLPVVTLVLLLMSANVPTVLSKPVNQDLAGLESDCGLSMNHSFQPESAHLDLLRRWR